MSRLRNRDALEEMIHRIDGRGYKAYKDIAGDYDFGDFTLHIEHVQGDPFASPSRFRIRISLSVLGIRWDEISHAYEKLAYEDVLLRKFAKVLSGMSRPRGTGGSGTYSVDAPGQEILWRSALVIEEGRVDIRFFVGLPARGRRILGAVARDMLLGEIPRAIRCLRFEEKDRQKYKLWRETLGKAWTIRDYIRNKGYVAFVADGSVLPRRSGVSQLPLENAVPFFSPDTLRVEIPTPFGSVSGMAIPQGITLITGGGFHGKSTLLSAIASGIYFHKPGDGRELVITEPTAVKVRAEDGRRIVGVDISSFIRNLPGGKDTSWFSTENASGSTSQAASIVEAIDAGAKLLLMDEDTCATNFMVRDERMARLIPGDKEPIIPLVSRVRELYKNYGVSTIMVVGGLGAFIDVADHIILMDNYQARDATTEAKTIASEIPYPIPPADPIKPFRRRLWLSSSLKPARKPKVKVKTSDRIIYGKEEIFFPSIDYIPTRSCLSAIGDIMLHLSTGKLGEKIRPEDLDFLWSLWFDGDWSGVRRLIGKRLPYRFAAVRPMDVAMVVNRYRGLEVEPAED